jgi:hypothetical protein
MQIMNLKFQSVLLIYYNEKNEWIINHIHLNLFFMYQVNHYVSHNFSSFYGSISHYLECKIWSSYILDFSLLLTQNSY